MNDPRARLVRRAYDRRDQGIRDPILECVLTYKMQFVNVDGAQQLAGTVPGVSPRPDDTVGKERLGDNVAHKHPRIERSIWVLEDNSHPATHLAESLATE